jgi:hypothetical protein
MPTLHYHLRPPARICVLLRERHLEGAECGSDRHRSGDCHIPRTPFPSIGSAGPVNVSPVSNFDYDYHKRIIVNLVYDTVSTLTDPIPGLTGQLLTVRWARIIRQGIDAFQNAANVLLGKGPKVLGNRFFEDQAIFSHALEGL